MKRVGTKGQRAALVGALLAVVLGGTGCGDDECVTAFDCQEKNPVTEGQGWTCVDHVCRAVDLTPPDGGADAGSDGGTGSDAGTDGGTLPDGGTDPCASVPRDAKLGTLQLQAGFTAEESAELSPEVLAVVSTPGPTYSLFGLRVTAATRDLVALGTWPDVKPGASAIDTILAPADRANAANTFPSHFLAYDGTRLLTGYTKMEVNYPGVVSVVDPAAREEASYFDAKTSVSAVGTADAFFINGGPVDRVSNTLGVYALVTSARPYVAVKAVTFPSQGVGTSGLSAYSTNSIAVFGYAKTGAQAGDFVNVAHAVGNAKLTQAVADRTPVVLADEPAVDVGSDFNAAAAFGNGVAMARGANSAGVFDVTDVSRFSLTPGLAGNQPVSVGAREPVLTAADACTSVDLLSSLGSDLLVGVTDSNGRRLVRIRQGQ
ncbi:hypothetical protein [Corallococcus macrosporus]|nr:hypothetical protein [Corallococcus macrosporus]